MAETVKVICRCRPMNSKELQMKCQNIIKVDDCAVHIENVASDSSNPPKTFTFDSAYGCDAPTEAIYNDICYALVENVLEGYNGTIFAYGQTGCGKSHTMQGPDGAANDKLLASQRGIISRAFDHIFERISVVSGVQYLALVSYLEIYNENIRDLLNVSSDSSSNLVLKDMPGEGIVVQNLSQHTVHNAGDCERLLALGTRNRIVGATLMNATSSRSHSIFTISLEQIANDGGKCDATPSIKKGKLNLVDLAGSERQGKTGATGDRLKEATKINLSLSALGNVISALVDGKTKHIPYRDSKLTRLLQDALGGNTKTLMIACISPAAYNYDETLSTLRYASRAKNIQNKPKINEDPKDTILREYQEEIVKLRQLLLLNKDNNSAEPAAMAIDVAAEKEKLRAEFERETIRLKNEHAVEQRQKEELVKDMKLLKQDYEQQMQALRSKAAASVPALSRADNEIAVQQTISMLKSDLIGGERANDQQLKEKHKKKKMAAEKRLGALAEALGRIEQNKDRDILEEHYSDIRQELQSKTDALKVNRQKIRALELEVSDLQSEFQLDRADYLETIRRLEKNLKFYQQLCEKALPLLRREGRYWDPDQLKLDAVWNDDLKKWKFPENQMIKGKLPPAEPLKQSVASTQRPHKKKGTATRNECRRENSSSLTAPGRLERSTTSHRLSANPAGCNTNYSAEHQIDDDRLSGDEESDFLIKRESLFFVQLDLKSALPFADDTSSLNHPANNTSSLHRKSSFSANYDRTDRRRFKDCLRASASQSAESAEQPMDDAVEDGQQSNQDNKKLERSDGQTIADTYFRPRRTAEILTTNRRQLESRVISNWKAEYGKSNKHNLNHNWAANTVPPNNTSSLTRGSGGASGAGLLNNMWHSTTNIPSIPLTLGGSTLQYYGSSPTAQNNMPLSHTWYGGQPTAAKFNNTEDDDLKATNETYTKRVRPSAATTRTNRTSTNT